MKITMSKDGLPRADFKVTARLCLYDFGTLLTCYLMGHISYSLGMEETKESHTKRLKTEVRDLIKKMSAKEIREKISETILQDGLEIPSYKVGDEGLSDLCDYVTALVAKRFKGFSK